MTVREEAFSDMKLKMDTLCRENVLLKARLDDLEQLPCLIKDLQSKIDSSSKDLDFIQNDACAIMSMS